MEDRESVLGLRGTGSRMVIREDRDGGGRITDELLHAALSWARAPDADQPDIVLEGFDGPGSYTILWRSRRVSLPDIPSLRTDTRPHIAGRGVPTASSSRPTRQASIPCQPTSQAHAVCGFSPLSSASAAPWAPRHRPSSGRSLRVAGAVPYRLLACLASEASELGHTGLCSPLIFSSRDLSRIQVLL